MNSNSKNEHNVIGVSSDTSLSTNAVESSLTNAPTTELQNMNYQDYLRMFEGCDNEFLENSERFVSTQGAVKIGISIVGKLLGSLGVPFSGQITNLYSFIIDQLWPSGKSQWEIFMEQVEELINQKIAEYARNKALAELEGLGANFQLYLEALEEWKETPHNVRALRDVRNRFEILDSLFTQYMPSFRISGYEVPLLTVYAQAANLHLLLLRDASIFGEEWGFSATTINNYYKRQMSVTAEYTIHCVEWYNTGLDRLNGSTAKQWVTYNRFRREMTLTVLDVVTLFPSYDVRTYPIGTTVQLTRELYTDPIGSVGQYSWVDPAPSFSEIENAVIRKPHEFDFISTLRIYTGLSRWDSSHYFYFWKGHEIHYKNSASRAPVVKKYGSTEKPVSIEGVNFDGQDVYKIKSIGGVLFAWTSQYYGVPKVDIYMVDRNNSNRRREFTYNPGYEGIGGSTFDSESELPPETLDNPNYQDYSHRLCYVGMIINSNSSKNPYVPIFSWTHRSADFKNTIYANKIAQIPISKVPNVIGGTFIHNLYTGGPILKLSGITNKKISFRVSTDLEGAGKEYRIRIKYASNQAGKFTITSKSSENPKTYETSIAYEKSMNTSNSLAYGDFSYAESTPIRLGNTGSSKTFDISLTKETGTDIYIDKIEFIPVM
ncbi:insecticidal delta-endotoxin Cry8Ea1 family protein [Bacillus thuringiensis]|uniref:insecticidal delta-endotoxin Cry8Ea1 family protein n=1 Tax=Bacillus thuringiensis TaxID=1428 RepID=UPI0009AB1590|nr:insecticidal delta-endotoxin Cry8Ea1 family protein [Bacillus thuringiensis]PEE68563.1 pesticidal protein [Bacillus thuringiensis]